MAISKLILNGEVQMDVTSDTVTAEKLLENETATKNDGTKVMGTLVAGEDVPVFTIDYGDYTEDPAITCNKTFAEMADYYIEYTTNPAIVYSITDSNPTLSKGAVINKITEDGSFYYVITEINDTGIPSNEIVYTSDNNMTTSGTRALIDGSITHAGYTFSPEDALFLNVYVPEGSATPAASVSATGATVTTGTNTLTLSKSVSNTPQVTEGWVSSGTAGNTSVSLTASVNTRGSTDLTANGSTVTAPSGYYSSAVSKSIAAGSAFPPAVTITTNPTIGVNTSGVVTASYNGSSSITPTVTSGYISQGTAGIISTTGTSTYQLTSQVATTYYPSTADQTIASQRWLVGNQTIKSVVTSNLTAENIVKGVVVKVGDSNNASSITQVTGTHEPTYTATITTSGNSFYAYVEYNGVKYYTKDTIIEFLPGEELKLVATSSGLGQAKIYIDGNVIDSNPYIYTLPEHNINIEFSTDTVNTFVNIFNADVERPYTATITNTGNDAKVYINHTGTKYYTLGDTFKYKEGDTCTITIKSYYAADDTELLINGESIIKNTGGTTITYTYTLPAKDVNIYLYYGTNPNDYVSISESIIPSGTLSITSNASYNVYGYSMVDVNSAGEYYYVYKAMAENTTLSPNISGFDSYITNLSSVKSQMFEGREFDTGTYEFTNTTRIGTGAFACQTRTSWDTKSVNFIFPSCSSIESYAFASRLFFYSINAPVCTSIGNTAFASCALLTTVSFPACTNIGVSAFYACRSLTTVSFPSCTSIGINAFGFCNFLTTVNFPSCTSIGNTAFASCPLLTTVSFPACTNIGVSAFYACSSLTTVSFPSCTSIGNFAFGYCRSLATANFPSCTSIGNSAFANCYNLLSLYLLGSSIPTLASKNAFSSTPISTYTTSTGGVYGSIYVPASLYNDYLTATNWSVYSSRFVSV